MSTAMPSNGFKIGYVRVSTEDQDESLLTWPRFPGQRRPGLEPLFAVARSAQHPEVVVVISPARCMRDDVSDLQIRQGGVPRRASRRPATPSARVLVASSKSLTLFASEASARSAHAAWFAGQPAAVAPGLRGEDQAAAIWAGLSLARNRVCAVVATSTGTVHRTATALTTSGEPLVATHLNRHVHRRTLFTRRQCPTSHPRWPVSVELDDSWRLRLVNQLPARASWR